MDVLATNRDSTETQGLLRLSRIVKSGNPMRRVSCLIIAILMILSASTVFAQQAGDGTTVSSEYSDSEASDSEASDSEEEDDSEPDDGLKDLMDMDLEQLRNVKVSETLETEVTSVSRTSQPVKRTPSAVYVITNEMIRRSGARRVSDALRLVPGLNVAELQSGLSAISARGDNGRFANKLLVQIDGRSVYEPTTTGTLWDVRGVMLENIDRIEVIRGPGATVWGANAVNGVINIITKSADQTQGVYADVGAGSRQRIFSSARVGGTTASGIAYRVYAMQNETGPGFNPEPLWGLHSQFRTGFRLDAEASCRDQITFQGDYVQGTSGHFRGASPGRTPYDATNLLARWVHTIDEDSEWAFQTYWDHSGRSSIMVGELDSFIRVDVLDFDVQYRVALGDRHHVVCGTGYRNNDMAFEFGLASPNTITPRSRFETVGFFAQDTITLAEDRLFATLGCKVEYNNYTQVEYQPSARVAWTPDERTSVWGAVSRAVRVPSLLDNSLRFSAGPFIWRGNPSIGSEVLWAYEAGMRRQMTEKFYWDFSAFYFDYDKMFNLNPVIPPFDLELVNDAEGYAYGCELWGTYEASDCWDLRGGYSFLREFRQLPPVAGAQWFPTTLAGNAPRHQFFLVSSHDLNCRTDLDLIFRYADRLSVRDVFGNSAPSYLTMDVRLAYRPRECLELAVVGRNLFDNHHPEMKNPVFVHAETVREVYATASWRY